MKLKTKLLAYLFSIFVGIIYCPLLMIGITDILGTAKGTEYLIAEPELSAYKQFGTVLLLVLFLVFVIIERMLKKKVYRYELKSYIINIFITFITIILMWPLFAY